MPSTIICPKCRKPQEESGRLTCPDCSAILPTNGPSVAVATNSTRGNSAASTALDDFPIPQRPTGAMTLLRNDLRSESKDRQQSGWLDNLKPKKGKETPEPDVRSKAARENSGLDTPAEVVPAEPKKLKSQPAIPAPAPAKVAPPEPVRVERPAPTQAPQTHFDTDAKPKIPVAGIVYGVVFGILAIVGLLQGQDGWLGSLVFLTVGLMGASILGVCNRDAARKAFWQGFAVFGIGYQLMAFVPAFPYYAGVEVPTNRVIKVVHAKIAGTPEDGRSSFAIMKVAEPAADTPAPFDPDASRKAAASKSNVAPGDLRQFTVVGHCGFTLFFAFIGSALSGWFYRNQFAG